MLNAHSGPVCAIAYSADCRHLATYSIADSKLLIWQVCGLAIS